MCMDMPAAGVCWRMAVRVHFCTQVLDLCLLLSLEVRAWWNPPFLDLCGHIAMEVHAYWGTWISEPSACYGGVDILG